MKPIAEWKRAYRMFSVQAIALLVAWLSTPESLQTAILQLFGATQDQITAILAVVAILGRLILQPKVHE